MKYIVKFLDFWHLSSGVNNGVKADSVVVKDENNLPFIPAKTIKGLVREAAEILGLEEFKKEALGYEGDKEGKLYFSNAYINENIAQEIISHNLQKELYQVLAFTKLDKYGVAEDNSLREIEFVVPIELEGEVLESEGFEEELEKCFKMIKRMGVNRNRGFGRCEIKVIK